MGSQIPKPATTVLGDAATNATATVFPSQPPGGQQIYVSLIVASYSDPTASGVLSVTTNVGNISIALEGSVVLPFDPPFSPGVSNSMAVQLGAGGVGVEGRVSMAYYVL